MGWGRGGGGLGVGTRVPWVTKIQKIVSGGMSIRHSRVMNQFYNFSNILQQNSG